MDKVEQLEQELQQARETNRRLNRRCQELESLLSSVLKDYQIAIDDARNHARRVRHYANDLRDLYRVRRRSIHEWYESEWQRLPKPSGLIDGIKARVDETLKLLGKQGDK